LSDLDPQASAALWADHRGNAFPAVLPAQAPRLAGLPAQAQADSADLVLLDTPPEADGIGSAAAAAADLTLIPCRPSALDLDAVGGERQDCGGDRATLRGGDQCRARCRR
jgi:chromosome partitioning protein